MDLDALVNEIYRRVQERVAACEAEPEAEANHIEVVGAEDKPVLGIISENHGEICHKVYECKQLAEYYRMRCALLEDTWDVENWEAVIAYTLTNEALGKIVNGIFDTPYTKAFGKALFVVRKSMFRKRMWNYITIVRLHQGNIMESSKQILRS